MTQELQRGIVTHFDRRKDKRLGFLAILDKNGKKTGERIFFHYGNGEWVSVVKRKIVFTGHFDRQKDPTEPPMPSIGDVLVFTDEDRARTIELKAAPWAYANSYDECVHELTETPNTTGDSRWRVASSHALPW